MNGAIDRESGAHSHFDGAFVENGERAGEAEADRARVGVRRIAKPRGAAAENLGFGEELDVDFQADNWLVLGEQFGRHGGFGGEFRHRERKSIASPRQVSARWEPLPGVGANGVASGHGQIGRQAIQFEPLDVSGLLRLTIECLAGPYLR